MSNKLFLVGLIMEPVIISKGKPIKSYLWFQETTLLVACSDDNRVYRWLGGGGGKKPHVSCHLCQDITSHLNSALSDTTFFSGKIY